MAQKLIFWKNVKSDSLRQSSISDGKNKKPEITNGDKGKIIFASP